ncbi:MAG TPA: glycosyltransferase family 9 protein [Gammaproteobacteria bacterium]|jgi:ADP-heptose:LPS heptosyltransferase
MAKSKPASPRILVIRNDKLGDFMLAWPALALLRQNLPDAHIAVLVPAYTAPLAQICNAVDETILDPRLGGEWRNGLALAKLLRPGRFDAVVTLFSRFDTGLAVRLAGIPLRYAPATKLAQMFYDHRIPQRRSRSEKPEYEYNLDLVRAYLADQGVEKPKAVEAPYLGFPPAEIKKLKQAFLKEHGIAATKQLVFVHAGHGGSANNLSLGQYGHLIRDMAAPRKRHFVLTAGPGEAEQAKRLGSLVDGPHTVFISKEGLVDFAKHLAFADCFVSGSTGPLHLAAALDRPTAAFYPRRRSSTALRWQTVNAEGKRLAFMPPETAEESDMGSIDIGAAAARIAKDLL